MLRRNEGGAEVSVREWTLSSSEDTGLGAIASVAHQRWMMHTKVAVQAGRLHRAATERPIRYPRRDLEQEPWVPVVDLVELEPLNEP